MKYRLLPLLILLCLQGFCCTCDNGEEFYKDMFLRANAVFSGTVTEVVNDSIGVGDELYYTGAQVK